MRKKLETDQTQRHKDDHLGRRKRRRGFLLARRGHCRQPPQMAYRRFRLQPCSAFLTASCPPSPFHNPQPSCVSLSSLSLWHAGGRFFCLASMSRPPQTMRLQRRRTLRPYASYDAVDDTRALRAAAEHLETFHYIGLLVAVALESLCHLRVVENRNSMLFLPSPVSDISMCRLHLDGSCRVKTSLCFGGPDNRSRDDHAREKRVTLRWSSSGIRSRVLPGVE